MKCSVYIGQALAVSLFITALTAFFYAGGIAPRLCAFSLAVVATLTVFITLMGMFLTCHLKNDIWYKITPIAAVVFMLASIVFLGAVGICY